MPEENTNNPSSGIHFFREPEEGKQKVKVLFSSSQESSAHQPEKKEDPIQPKVLSFSQKEEGSRQIEHKITDPIEPKVLLFASQQEENTKTQQEGSNVPKPKVLFGEAKAPSTVPARPEKPSVTVLFSTEASIRRKIEVSVEVLRTIDANIDDATSLQKAKEMISFFNFEDGRDEKFFSFGTREQEENSKLAHRILEISSNEAFEKTKRSITEIINTMNSLDRDLLLGTKKNIFSFLKPKENISPREKLRVMLEDTKKRIVEIQQYLPILIELRDETKHLHTSIPHLIRTVDAAIVAGKYLSSYGASLKNNHDTTHGLQKTDKLDTALSLLGDRVQSLGITKMGLFQAMQQLEIQERGLTLTIQNIQEVTLTLLPTWQSTISSIMVLLQTQPIDKDTRDLHDLFTLQEKILERLKR